MLSVIKLVGPLLLGDSLSSHNIEGFLSGSGPSGFLPEEKELQYCLILTGLKYWYIE